MAYTQFNEIKIWLEKSSEGKSAKFRQDVKDYLSKLSELLATPPSEENSKKIVLLNEVFINNARFDPKITQGFITHDFPKYTQQIIEERAKEAKANEAANAKKGKSPQATQQQYTTETKRTKELRETESRSTTPKTFISLEEIAQMIQSELNTSGSKKDYKVALVENKNNFSLTVVTKESDDLDASAALQAARFREALQDVVKSNKLAWGEKDGKSGLLVPQNINFKQAFIEREYRKQIFEGGKFADNFNKLFANPLVEVYQNTKSFVSKASSTAFGMFQKSETELKLAEMDNHIDTIRNMKSTTPEEKIEHAAQLIKDGRDKNKKDNLLTRFCNYVLDKISNFVNSNKKKIANK